MNMKVVFVCVCLCVKYSVSKVFLLECDCYFDVCTIHFSQTCSENGASNGRKKHGDAKQGIGNRGIPPAAAGDRKTSTEVNRRGAPVGAAENSRYADAFRLHAGGALRKSSAEEHSQAAQTFAAETSKTPAIRSERR